MLIKNIEVVDHLRVFKETIYQIVRKVNANLNYSSVGALQLFLIHLLITIPFVAILFKNDDFFPPLVSKSTPRPTQSSESVCSASSRSTSQ